MILGESVTAMTTAGGLLILFGVYLVRRSGTVKEDP